MFASLQKTFGRCPGSELAHLKPNVPKLHKENFPPKLPDLYKPPSASLHSLIIEQNRATTL